MGVPTSVLKNLFIRSRAYCEIGGEDFAFYQSNIHHIDRDHENNDMNNLLLLCPNCHSQARKQDSGTTQHCQY